MCKAVYIINEFLDLWSICLSSFLIHFKNGPEYLTRGTSEVSLVKISAAEIVFQKISFSSEKRFSYLFHFCLMLSASNKKLVILFFFKFPDFFYFVYSFHFFFFSFCLSLLIYYFLWVFHTNVSWWSFTGGWWSFTGGWVTTSILMIIIALQVFHASVNWWFMLKFKWQHLSSASQGSSQYYRCGLDSFNSSLDFQHGIVPRAATIIIITVTIFHSFFSSLVRSRYLSIFFFCLLSISSWDPPKTLQAAKFFSFN